MRSFDRLPSLVTHNIGTKVISVVIAIVLWMIVLGSRNIEVTKEVPLEVITASDVVPANEIPDKVTFRLSGPRAFLRAIVDRREEPIRINFSNSPPSLVSYRFYSDSIHVPPEVKVLAISPTAVLLKLEYLRKREVPIKVELRGEPPEGYRIAETKVDPPVITIKGPESRVQKMTEVMTDPIDVSGLTETRVFDPPLQLERPNVQVDGKLPRVTVEVEPMSANYRIRNVDVRVLTQLKATLDDRTVTVLVRAEPEALKSLERSRVYGVVDLRGKPKGRYTEPVKLKLPEGVTLVKVIPDKVRVLLK